MTVFDFDDCGYGPIEFDVASSLYMELFGALQNDQMDHYINFRAGFVGAYMSESGVSIDDELLDDLVGVRRDALGHWIEHLDQAPIGIRNSPPEWLEQLKRFVGQI
jgi:Ser/Thr protein kinase RdoA (MazF antagonist)